MLAKMGTATAAPSGSTTSAPRGCVATPLLPTVGFRVPANRGAPMAVDLRIQVALTISGFARATDIVDEIRALVEREGWDPDAVVQFTAEPSQFGSDAR